MVGYSLSGCKESDMTEQLNAHKPFPTQSLEGSLKKHIFPNAPRYLSLLSLYLTGKESSCNAGDLGLIPGLGRSPGEGNGYPLQYSGLENSMAPTFGPH